MPQSESIAIDFSEPNAFRANYKLISEKFRAAVVGTTGWDDIKENVIRCFREKNKSFVYASNFSVGVNILFDLIEKSSDMLSKVENYDPYVLEMHHKEKKDSPSGTAVTIREIIRNYFKKDVSVASVRSGNIKGMHEVGYESSIDKISIKHEAYSREGFALGAVMAAEWLHEKAGIYSFRELLRKNIK
jgi:4-hydroxy-tetrahydrodipicolinate reductase